MDIKKEERWDAEKKKKKQKKKRKNTIKNRNFCQKVSIGRENNIKQKSTRQT